MKSFTKYFNYFFLSIIIIIWPAIQNLLLGGIDGAGRLTIFMLSLAILVNAKRAYKGMPAAFLLPLIWCIYCTVNTYVKGFALTNMEYPNWVLTSLILPWVAMFVMYIECRRDFTGVITVLFFTFAAYFLIGAPFLKTDVDYDGELRTMNALGNPYFLTSLGLVFCSGILYLKKKMSLPWLVAILAVSIVLFIFSGTRKVFGASVIMVAALYLARSGKKAKKKSLLRYGALAAIILVLFFIVMSYTPMGARMQFSMNKNSSQYDSVLMQLLGDRAIQYVHSWEMFWNNKLTGIGLMKYSELNIVYEGLPLHSEYMVELAECGLVGASLFAAFYILMFRRLIFNCKNGGSKELSAFLLGSLLAIAFINFTSWTYDSPVFYMWFGLFFAVCPPPHKTKKSIRCLNSTTKS